MNFSKSKKILSVILVLSALTAEFFGQSVFGSSESELSIYNEVNSAFYTGFYPGAVEKANLLKKKYPESVFIIPTSVIKGEALVNLGRFSEASEVFVEIIPSIHLGDENYERAYFYLGEAYFYQSEYEKALSCFYKCTAASVSQNHLEYYNQSLLFAGRGLYITENYEKAISVLEYLENHKLSIEPDEYYEVLQKLMICYNKTANYSKTIELFKFLDKNDFADEIYYRLEFQLAAAYEATGEDEKAYDIYCNIIQSGIKELAVISLQKAYLITTKENAAVRSETLFEMTQGTFEQAPAIVYEFWVRLAVDFYAQQKFAQSLVYFESAEKIAKNNVVDFEYIIRLYKEKIRLETETLDEDEALEVEKKLRGIEKQIQKSDFENISDVYYSTILKCKITEQNWAEAEEVFKKIGKADSNNLYYYACAEFNLKNYEKVIELVKDQNETKFLNLAAKAYVCSNNYKKARTYYEKLLFQVEKDENLLPMGTTIENLQLEYCKVLYKLKDFSNCLKSCNKLIEIYNTKDAEYLAGLSAINLKKWKEAIGHFGEYEKVVSKPKDFLKNLSADEKQFYLNMLYYSGYANYVTGEYAQAYRYFAKYNESSIAREKYAALAYEFAAKSALQLRQYQQAAVQAEKLIQSVTSESEKHSAVYFCAEIYIDSERYDEAIRLLRPWSENKDDFAITCLYKIAQIYQKSGNLNQAESTYENLITSYGKNELAEDSLFNCGEMFYSAGKFQKAEEKFSRYIYKYVEGKYAERALFFSGDCNYKLEKFERSAMLFTRLTEKYTASTYLYGSYINLLNCDYELENYEDALRVAKILQNNFVEQARNDGIPSRVTELEKLLSGFDTATARKFSEFEKFGGIKTVKGRHAGTQLVQMYITDEATNKDGIVLALQLLPLEQGNLEEEAGDAAINANIIADWYRANGSTKEAAEYYLLAAEYYRGSNEIDYTKPAAALYSAAEAFVAEGMNGDARETAALLVELYPDTKYSEAVGRLRIK